MAQVNRIHQHLTQLSRVFLYTAIVPLEVILLDVKANSEPLLLRLILLPAARYLKLEKDEVVSFKGGQQPDGVHFIDGLSHSWIKNETTGEMHGMQINFLVVENHGLSDTHCAVAVNLVTGRLIIPIGSLRSLKEEQFIVSQSVCCLWRFGPTFRHFHHGQSIRR